MDDPRPEDDDVQPHASPLVRAVLIACGTIAVALGLIGVFLPVLPTTPFLLLAAACYARASPSLYRRIAHSKTLGPAVIEWRRHRSIPWRTKLFAIVLMSVSILVTATLFVRPWWGKAALIAVGLATAIWLYRIPSRDRPDASRTPDRPSG